MRKRSFAAIFVAAVMLVTCAAFAAGCGIGGGGETPDPAPQEYTIQYTDESGAHTITVTNGMPYSLDVVPTKTGYDFLGLFDSEVGGTQYVSSSGSSLAPFTDKKNMVLFPQYKAKDYTVILDYQGAAVTGSRQLTVTYGQSLPELPKNLKGEHKVFAGWYTEAECGGVQIADEYGLIPLVSVLNEQNFDLSGASVTLYAGFETEKFTVTCCFEEGMDTEELQVVYDTPVNRIVPKTRVDGNAVLAWSKTPGGEAYIGTITADTVLYAVEYAPVIEFNTDGGNAVIPVVARAGSTVSLPVPTKDLAKFAYWEDADGSKYEATTMPSKSITLKAVWQAKLVFDENGGSDVDDISVAAGNKITLPTPEREGFIFAGWYNADKEQYTSTTMPTAGVALKAGWYKALKTTQILSSGSSYSGSNKAGYKWITVELSNLVNSKNAYFTLNYHLKLKSYDEKYLGKANFACYSMATASDAYLIDVHTFNVTKLYKDSFQDVSWSINIQTSNDVYMCMYYTSYKFYMDDYYVDIYYPDMANFYL